MDNTHHHVSVSFQAVEKFLSECKSISDDRFNVPKDLSKIKCIAEQLISEIEGS